MSLETAAEKHGGDGEKEESGRFGNEGDVVGGGAEVGGEVDEVGDGDGRVVVEIAVGPGDLRTGFVEVRPKLDEVGDGDLAVEV